MRLLAEVSGRPHEGWGNAVPRERGVRSVQGREIRRRLTEPGVSAGPFAAHEEAPPDHSGGASSWWRTSGETDVGCLRTLLTRCDLELDALALFEGAVARRLDGRVVSEDVLGAFVGGDEAESLFGIEPLH